MLYDRSYLQRSQFGGPGVISGTVAVEGTAKPNCKLLLMQANKIIDAAWTDTLGKYEFTNLSLAYEYSVIAFDPDGIWEAKVSTNRKPGVP